MLAEDLGISASTVRNHLKEIFRKLRVSSQAQWVRRVKRHTIEYAIAARGETLSGRRAAGG